MNEIYFSKCRGINRTDVRFFPGGTGMETAGAASIPACVYQVNEVFFIVVVLVPNLKPKRSG